MADFLQFEEDLREALPRLRNPGYVPPLSVCEVSCCSPQDGAGEVYLHVMHAIKTLEADVQSQPGSQPSRLYEFLQLRFGQGLNQEEIAERMFMSVRNVQRIQLEAIHFLALQLWEKYRGIENKEQTDWKTQVEKELISLESNQPESTSDVKKVIHDLLELKGHLLDIYGVEIEEGFIQPGIIAAIHPSAMRQVLLTILVRLARVVQERTIEIYSGMEDGQVKISIAGQVQAETVFDAQELTSGIPIPSAVSIAVNQKGEHLFVHVWLQSSGQCVVLVVEDNLDVVHYYRRCTAGTNFQIVHAPMSERGVDFVKTIKPEIIVLDLMMPDIDGWQLLTHLHENPDTRPIPVIICSIVQEPDLAFALGATICLPKPVKHQQFVQALNQALSHSRAANLRGGLSSQ